MGGRCSMHMNRHSPQSGSRAICGAGTGFNAQPSQTGSERLPVEVDSHPVDGRQYAEYRNVSKAVGAIVSSRLATLYELGEHLGTEDLYILLEILTVDNHNQRVANERRN
jgi:hypothetical protein